MSEKAKQPVKSLKMKSCRPLTSEEVMTIYNSMPENKYVKKIKQGKIIEIRTDELGIFTNSTCHIQKLNDKQYVVKKTGEVKEYKKTVRTTENGEVVQYKSKKTLKKTFEKMREMINTNFTMEDVLNDRVRFLTLTYADENVKGKEGNQKVGTDMKAYIEKLHRHYGEFEFLYIVEPQGRETWHIHMLMKFEKRAPRIEGKLWKQGFSKIVSVGKVIRDGGYDINEIDNIGAYLTAYLTDIPVEDMSKYSVEEQAKIGNLEVTEKGGHKYIKGGRTYLYPAYMQIFRYSKGLEQPKKKVVRKTYVGSDEGFEFGLPKETVSLVRGYEVKFESVEDGDLGKKVEGSLLQPENPQDDDDVINHFLYIQYNLNRVESQATVQQKK